MPRYAMYIDPDGMAGTSSEYGAMSVRNAGNSGTAATVDWSLSQTERYLLTGNCTFTFANPTDGARYALILEQDATGSRLVTWPTSIKWPDGSAPTLTTTAGKIDIVSFLYYNATYFGKAETNF